MKHRPICDVLEEIKAKASNNPNCHHPDIIALCDEALTYARKMHERIQQNKKDMLAFSYGGRIPDTHGSGSFADIVRYGDSLMAVHNPRSLNEYAALCHEDNVKWWQDLDTKQPLKRNKGELLMLIVSEIAEAMEGERKDLMDDKLPKRKMAEVELADALIRIFDYAGAYGYDIDGAFWEKRAFNASREDHKHEARIITGGKQF